MVLVLSDGSCALLGIPSAGAHGVLFGGVSLFGGVCVSGCV